MSSGGSFAGFFQTRFALEEFFLGDALEQFVSAKGASGLLDFLTVSREIPPFLEFSGKEGFLGIEFFHLLEVGNRHAKSAKGDGMNGIRREVGKELVKEGEVALLEIHAVDERVDAQTDRPAQSGNFFHCPDPGGDGGYLVLELIAYFIGGKTEGGDDVGKRIGLLENLEVYALGPEFKLGVRVFGKEGKEGICKPRDVFQGQAVAIVSGKEPTWLFSRFLGLAEDFVLEIIVIYKKDVVGGGKHSLEEAVSAVVQTIEEVGEVEVSGSSNPVGRGHGVDEGSGLVGKDKGGFLLLETETLPARVENVLVMGAWNEGRPRMATKYFQGSRMVEDSLLMVDYLDHERILCCSMIFRSSEIACFADFAFVMAFRTSFSGKPRAWAWVRSLRA